MLLTRKNPLGGPKLKQNSFPITEENGQLGFKIGYLGRCPHCDRGIGEAILIKTTDAELIANKFASLLYTHQGFLNKLKSKKTKEPWKIRFVKWLLGSRRDYENIRDEVEEY